MRTAEESSGTVLHRLIQEQLRYGNLTDTRTLLAIQQQALRGGSGGSPRSSLESLNQDESQYMQMSARQEPQGQEHQGDGLHSESPVCRLYQLHGEELPTYEEAKAKSLYLISQKDQVEQGGGGSIGGVDVTSSHGEGRWDVKREHARSLSERLMQLSLERNGHRDDGALHFSHSYPQLYDHHVSNTQGVQQQCADPRGPPPDYPFCARLPGYGHGQYYGDSPPPPPPPPPPLYSQHHRYVSAQSQAAHGNDSAPASSDALMRENERLRKELEVFTEKAARLQKLELEIQRISEAYETLMKGSAKREALEKTMRNKLEAEIKRMHDFNRDLREQLDTATKQRAAREAECVDQKQHVFMKLLEQKEEQQRERERLERQVQHMRLSADECQRRRDALERGLASAQTRSRQLEEELQRKRAYVEKVERLQSSLAQLQAACEKRELLELRLRTRLEQELKSLRAQRRSQNQQVDPTSSEPPSSSALQQQLREKEERVLALEADITKWEQKYLEESTMRQFAMDAAATAAAQRDTTIINHSPRHSPNSSFNDNQPSSSHRRQEMENRIRALHAQLLEKDAVITVLHQRSRLDQGRLEKQGLRLARSVPSINTATGTSTGTGTQPPKGKSLSDDLTGAAALRPVTGWSRDFGTQSDDTSPESTKDASEEPTFKSTFDGSDAEMEMEMVEILI